MSVFRPQTVQRLGGSISRPAWRFRPTSARSFGSSTPRYVDSPSMANPEESAIKNDEPLDDVPDYDSPNYESQIDHGSSSFSPVPRHIMDGSEPGEVLAAAVLSGAPRELQSRGVRSVSLLLQGFITVGVTNSFNRIFRPAKTATQSGSWHGHQWRMDWDILQKGHRWEHPLMGWQASADGMQGTHLNFKTKDDAVLFAEKQGYPYWVQGAQERRLTPKAYAANFVHEPKKLKHIKTK